jgi:hypothetical protein
MFQSGATFPRYQRKLDDASVAASHGAARIAAASRFVMATVSC